MMFNKILFKFILMLFTGLSVVSCGVSTSVLNTAGISGTGIVFGVITGFGSIYINGIKYEIDNTAFDVDGNTAAGQEQLKIGMVVQLEFTEYDDGTYVASAVYYDENIEGPILTVPQSPLLGDPSKKEFNVLGQNVVADATNTIYENVTFETLAIDDLVEVSGFIDTSGKVQATLIEKKSPADLANLEVEIHGQVTNLIENASFKINGINVVYDLNTELEDIENNTLLEGMQVEVGGIYNASSRTVTAHEIESEEGEGDLNPGVLQEDESLSLQGYVADFISISDFQLKGVPVDASNLPTTVTSRLQNGVYIEAQGLFTNGKLIAEQIEIHSDGPGASFYDDDEDEEDGDGYNEEQYADGVNQDGEDDADEEESPENSEVSYAAKVHTVAGDNTLQIYYPGITRYITLRVDEASELEDETDEHDPLLLTDLEPDDEVEVEAQVINSDLWVKSLHRKDLEGDYAVEGMVSTTANNQVLTILGVDFDMASNAEYTIEGQGSVSAMTFFNAVESGFSTIELQDKYPADGQFDQASIED